MSIFYNTFCPFLFILKKKQEVFFMNVITEIIMMKTVEGIGEEEFIYVVNSLEENFHAKQTGFIDTELLYNDKVSEWIMIQHWDSFETLKSASQKIFHDKAAKSFVESLRKESVKMIILPQIRKWKSLD